MPKPSYLYLFFLLVYGLSIGTRFASSDAQVMYETSRTLAFARTFALAGDFGLPQIRQGADGRYYSQYDPGLPLLAAGVVWGADRLAAWQLWNRYAFAAYAVRWISAAGAALAVALVYALGATWYGARRGLALALLVGLCSPLWAYGRLFFAEGLLAGLLTLAFWAAWHGWAWTAGAAFGVAVLTRAAMLIYALPLLYLVLPLPSHKLLPRFAAFVGLPALALVGLLHHNALRSGDALRFGYAGQAFDTPFWVGAVGMLFSPGKSVFLYAPPLLLSLWGFPRFHQREPRLARALLAAAGVALVFYGSWWAWGGGWSWSPRFLVPLIPLWMLPAGEVLRGSRLVWGVALAGLAVGFVGAFTDVNRHYARYDVVNYSLSGSPLVGAFDSLLAGALESPGAFHLQSMGWLPLPATLFPVSLIVIGLLCLVYMVVKVYEQ